MSSPRTTKNTRGKEIRFPHETIERINERIEIEKQEDAKVNFSSWVINACEKELKRKPKQ